MLWAQSQKVQITCSQVTFFFLHQNSKNPPVLMGNSLASAAPAVPAPPPIAPPLVAPLPVVPPPVAPPPVAPLVAPPPVLREQGGADGSAAWRIDSDLLEANVDDIVCALCLGVLVVPTSGCPQGHTFCLRCYGEALQNRLECPTCRRPADQNTLVFNRHLEGMMLVSHFALATAHRMRERGSRKPRKARHAGTGCLHDGGGARD